MAPRTLPIIEISGNPLDRGRQYGEAVRPRLHTALAYYEEAFGHSSGLTWQQVTARAARWLDPVRDYAPDLVEEMRGIADGAGVDLLDVLALNARGEVIYDRSFARMGEARGSFRKHPSRSPSRNVPRAAPPSPPTERPAATAGSGPGRTGTGGPVSPTRSSCSASSSRRSPP